MISLSIVYKNTTILHTLKRITEDKLARGVSSEYEIDYLCHPTVKI